MVPNALTSGAPRILPRLSTAVAGVRMGGALVLLSSLVVVSPASAAVAVPTAPSHVTAGRSAQDVRDFTVSWSAGTGPITEYAVIVFVDGKRTQRTVPAATRQVLVQGSSLQSIYQVHVAALNAEKKGAVSEQITVNPVLPGPPVDLDGSVSTDGSGITARWAPPQRSGLNPVLRYTVTFTDTVSRRGYSYATTETRLDAPVDAGRIYEVSVSAVTRNGASIPETTHLGGAGASAPRWFTAVRDNDAPGQIVLNWSVPSWAGDDDVITGYEIGSGAGTVTAWTPVGDTLTATAPLGTSASGVYSVRALTARGASLMADPVPVETAVKSLFVNDVYPIAASSSGSDVTLRFSDGSRAIEYPWLSISLLPTDGWTYRDHALLADNAKSTVSFDDVPSGRYRVMVVGYSLKNLFTSGQTLFNEEIIVNDLSDTMNATEASFSDGNSMWHGIYPPVSLPSVVMTEQMSYDGSAAMAVTAKANSVGRNITAGAGPARAVPVSAGKQLVVSAQGFATTRPTQWNLGISWWDGSGRQIALSRTLRLRNVQGSWKTSGGTFIAPPGAVAASAFVEIGELLRGQTFYIDDIALRSYVPAQQVQTATDWTTVRGETQLIGGTVSMTGEGATEVLDPTTPGADISVNTQAQLISGSAYGIAVRATSSGSGTNAYLVQVHRSAGAHTMYLRQVVGGTACATPLASAALPRSFDAAVPHRVTVRAAGNALGVLLAGKQVLTVSSLSSVVAAKKCGTAPTGTGVGLTKAADASAEFTAVVLNRA